MAKHETHCWEKDAWKQLEANARANSANGIHLVDLMQDNKRCAVMAEEFSGILLDYSRQRMTLADRNLLFDLARQVRLEDQIQSMVTGKFINQTEQRAVLHHALRVPKDYKPIIAGDTNVVPQVHDVLDRIFEFSRQIRSGELVGAGGARLTNVISIGIGGSYLGPEFVFESLKTDSEASTAAKGRTLRFLANVDPVDASRALSGLDPACTLVVVVSKTFTTAETMLNARTVKKWLQDAARERGWNVADTLKQQMVALSTNVEAATAFGIAESNVFGFWDWVGGRYSVCSPVGVMPLALQYGEAIVRDFLQGAHEMDVHFMTAPLESNLPVLLGLLGVWNSSFLGLNVRALLPYSQALLRFPAHIQQVDMESNGKRVTMDGTVLPIQAGEINFGEPGTNGQHSFYQLIHQGREMSCDFIGSIQSQQPIDNPGEVVSNHDELMSNFFAQPDALAYGKTQNELRAEGVPERLWAHKEFPGNRPSSSLLFPCFDAKRIGQLLALYEHRSAVQGFVWGINSFDQWGVELGKVLATQVRNQLSSSRKDGAVVEGFNSSTTSMLERYLHFKTC